MSTLEIVPEGLNTVMLEVLLDNEEYETVLYRDVRESVQ